MNASNLAFRFLLELGMLAAVWFWGFRTGHTVVADLVLGVGAPAVVAALWGIFAAPKSERRLQGAALVAVQVTLLCVGAVALIAAGRVALGVIFAAAVLINAVLVGADAEV